MTALLSPQPILFAAGFIGCVGSVLLLRNRQHAAQIPFRAVPSTGLAAALIQPVASFGHALRGELPPSVVFSVVNAAQILALSLLWLGACRMGLSICRDLVTGMGGTIEARNTAEGAVFTIALPVALGPGAAP